MTPAPGAVLATVKGVGQAQAAPLALPWVSTVGLDVGSLVGGTTMAWVVVDVVSGAVGAAVGTSRSPPNVGAGLVGLRVNLKSARPGVGAFVYVGAAVAIGEPVGA